MLIAMIEHPPAFGKKLKSFDASETLKMPGIKDVFTIKLYEDGFEQGGFDTRTFNDLLVVVGNTTWEVMNARKKLKVTWEPSGEIKDIMAGRNGKREVIIPVGLESTSTHLAKMAEYAKKPAQLLRRDGLPYVERVFSAIDCGIVINPDAATNRVQGAVIDGIGNALYGGLTHKDGAAEQNNFNRYRIIRFREAPKKIDVHFVENDIDSTGLGEPPFPPVFGAVANALYKNTGKRFYNQPFYNALQNVST